MRGREIAAERMRKIAAAGRMRERQVAADQDLKDGNNRGGAH